MLHLAFDLDPVSLGRSPFSPRFRGGLSLPAARLGLPAADGAMLTTAPSIAGFVGADAVAACVAAGLAETEQTVLLLDIGTNAEMVLCHRGRMVACSAAAGPAFEGVGITCGVSAQPGAIYAVVGDANVRWETIDGMPAIGLCGTGLVDLVAVLLTHGLLASDGRLRPRPSAPEPVPGLAVSDGAASLTAAPSWIGVTQRDIRTLQLAVAAVRAGWRSLLHVSGVSVDEVERVVITGSFGSSLRLESLVTLGLLPSAWKRRAELRVNAAGEGAVLCLLDEGCVRLAERIAAATQHVELEKTAGFQQMYLSSLTFPDLRERGTGWAGSSGSKGRQDEDG